MNFITNSICRSIHKNSLKNFKQVRHSHGPWVYRQVHQPPKWARIGSIVVSCCFGVWMGWNLFYDWEACIAYYGGKPLPNPRAWTDEELCIPLEEDA